MRTSYFWKANHEPEIDRKYISVSAGVQKGSEHFPVYKKLAPDWDIINLAHKSNYSIESMEIYKKEYFRQLSNLDPEKIYSELKNCTVLCMESPKDLASGKKYCHRRMIAGWIETELGIAVPEETREKEKHLIVPAIFK